MSDHHIHLPLSIDCVLLNRTGQVFVGLAPFLIFYGLFFFFLLLIFGDTFFLVLLKSMAFFSAYKKKNLI